MAGSVSGELKAEPNLTPLLDIVFQLITFFMLVSRFNAEAFDQRVNLPVAGSARPVEGGKATDDRITLNVDADGRLLWYGQVLIGDRAVDEIRTQARLTRLNAKYTGEALDPDDPSLPTTVVIRADRATPFSDLYRLISACQANGFHKFDLKAMTGEGAS